MPLSFPRVSFWLCGLSCILFSVSVEAQNVPYPSGTSKKILNRIAFGSCSKASLSLKVYDAIAERKADLFIFLGDNVYPYKDKVDSLPPEYARLKASESYRHLANTTPIVACWDDHDYAMNDGGIENPDKVRAKELFLSFFGVPQDAPIRKHGGVYQSFTYGPKGKQVKIILLDNRWFRGTQIRKEKAYVPNPDADLLGEEQWQWLEKELATDKAQFTIIGNGIQVIAEEHPFEKWANFPASRNRLFHLIAKSKLPGVVLISGDRHISEISALDTLGMGYPLYDITSSGLTHVYAGFTTEPNRHRLGECIVAVGYGELNITWAKQPTLTLEFRGQTGELLRSQNLAVYPAKKQ